MDPPDEFEKQRRIQETHNERVICLVRSALLAVVIFVNVLASVVGKYFHPVLPRPPGVASLFGEYLLCNVALLLYLRSEPPYSSARKYAIIVADTGVFFLSFVLNVGKQYGLEKGVLFFPIVV